MAKKKWVEGLLVMDRNENPYLDYVRFLPTKSMHTWLIFNKRDKRKKWGLWEEYRNPEEKHIGGWMISNNVFLAFVDKFKETYDAPWLKPGTKFLVDLEV